VSSGGEKRAAAHRQRPAAGVATRARGWSTRTWKSGVEPAATWTLVVSLVLSVAGLGVSIYETVAHFAKLSLICPDSGGAITCKKVTTSPQSYFLHVPVAVLGLAFFVAMVALCSPPAWRAADRRVHLVRLGLSVVGLCFVLYLVAAELLIIGSICLWCTSVHVITFLLFVVVLTTVPTMLGWGVQLEGSAGSRARALPAAERGRRTGQGNQGRASGGNGKRPSHPRKQQDRQLQRN